jgi:hypothetical protein
MTENQTKPEAVAEGPTAATPANVYDHASPKATDDVEAQKPAPAAASSEPAAASEYDDEAGKSIGIAMFVCIVVGFVLAWIPLIGPYITFCCLIAAIVLASTITCGCCCGANLKLNPKVKRWSTATLLCLVIQWVLYVIALIVAYSGAAASAYTYDTTTTEITSGVAWTLIIVAQIVYILAAVFAGIFTWGRKSCGNA